MDTFRQLRHRLRAMPSEASAPRINRLIDILDDTLTALGQSRDPNVYAVIRQRVAKLDPDPVVKALHDTLTALAAHATVSPALDGQAIAKGVEEALARALNDRVFAPIVDAATSRETEPPACAHDGLTIAFRGGGPITASGGLGGSAEAKRETQPERLPNVEQRAAVSREPAAAVFDTPPVLPPGFRMERLESGGSTVFQSYDRTGDEDAWSDNAEQLAAALWRRFGAFMSREDYQDLVSRAHEGAGLRDRLADSEQRREVERKAAHQALDAAGVGREITFPPGSPVARKTYGLAERITMLASKIGDRQAVETYAREEAERERDHERTVARDLQREVDRLRPAHALATETVSRVGRALRAAGVGYDEVSAGVGALAASRDAAERRTEAHRVEIGRLTETIQRLRKEAADWKARADQEIALGTGYLETIADLQNNWTAARAEAAALRQRVAASDAPVWIPVELANDALARGPEWQRVHDRISDAVQAGEWHHREPNAIDDAIDKLITAATQRLRSEAADSQQEHDRLNAALARYRGTYRATVNVDGKRFRLLLVPEDHGG
jgi:hypothetical protein